MADLQMLKDMATQVRRDILRMTNAASCGHPGGAMGCAEYFVALYFELMKHDRSFKMDGKGEDVFFLSNGHICAGWYSVLARSGYFDPKELGSFRKLGSRLQGHPAVKEGLPGIRMASGSLGQGMSVAAGMALSKKLNGDDRTVFSLHGDGELQEGQIWEAAIFAAHHKIDNLIATIDFNNAQIDGKMEDVMDLGDIGAKFSAFGWEVLHMNGNDMEQTLDGLRKAMKMCGKGKPIAIIMETKMGHGVDFMDGDYRWHGVAPSDEQLEEALKQLEESIGDYPA